MIEIEKVQRCLEENGIIVDENGEMMDVESINFIASVICLEEEFNIEFPDEMLSFEKIGNLYNLCNLIQRLK